jgi:uncharacterized OB-fold protein
MSAPNVLKPDLYAPEGTPRHPQLPSLKGGECTCGHVFFPMQSFGCESCGRWGDDLKPRSLSGVGRIVSLATVHLHAGKGRQAPFTVAMIALEDGPTVRTLLDAASEKDARAGSQVVATLVLTTPAEDGAPRLDLRFALQR